MEAALADAKARVLEGFYVPDYNIPPQNMGGIIDGNQGWIDITNQHIYGVHDM